MANSVAKAIAELEILRATIGQRTRVRHSVSDKDLLELIDIMLRVFGAAKMESNRADPDHWA